MASSPNYTGPYLLVAPIFCALLFACIAAQGEDYEPVIGPLGEHPDGVGGLGDKSSDHGEEDGVVGPDHGKEDGDLGPGGDDPAHIVSQALLCFNEKHIYSKCEESYRLTESGELHVPSEHVPKFCGGPCLEETNLVLHCLDTVMDHFLFYNKITTHDVKDTILACCSHGGDLDVPEHIEADGEGQSIGSKAAVHTLFGIVIAILGQLFF